jgi:hypothetical protein
MKKTGEPSTTKGTKYHEGIILQAFFCGTSCPSWQRFSNPPTPRTTEDERLPLCYLQWVYLITLKRNHWKHGHRP